VAVVRLVFGFGVGGVAAPQDGAQARAGEVEIGLDGGELGALAIEGLLFGAELGVEVAQLGEHAGGVEGAEVAVGGVTGGLGGLVVALGLFDGEADGEALEAACPAPARVGVVAGAAGFVGGGGLVGAALVEAPLEVARARAQGGGGAGGEIDGVIAGAFGLLALARGGGEALQGGVYGVQQLALAEQGGAPLEAAAEGVEVGGEIAGLVEVHGQLEEEVDELAGRAEAEELVGGALAGVHADLHADQLGVDAEVGEVLLPGLEVVGVGDLELGAGGLVGGEPVA
jgi:hypothetical protein